MNQVQLTYRLLDWQMLNNLNFKQNCVFNIYLSLHKLCILSEHLKMYIVAKFKDYCKRVRKTVDRVTW